MFTKWYRPRCSYFLVISVIVVLVMGCTALYGIYALSITNRANSSDASLILVGERTLSSSPLPSMSSKPSTTPSTLSGSPSLTSSSTPSLTWSSGPSSSMSQVPSPLPSSLPSSTPFSSPSSAPFSSPSSSPSSSMSDSPSESQISSKSFTPSSSRSLTPSSSRSSMPSSSRSSMPSSTSYPAPSLNSIETPTRSQSTMSPTNYPTNAPQPLIPAESIETSKEVSIQRNTTQVINGAESPSSSFSIWPSHSPAMPTDNVTSHWQHTHVPSTVVTMSSQNETATYNSSFSHGSLINSSPSPSSSNKILPPETSFSSPATIVPSWKPSILPTIKATRPIFYVMGDVPYSDLEVDKMKSDIAGIPDDADFIVHVGDINKALEEYCKTKVYTRAKDILSAARHPLFIIPGDNDIFDCPSVKKATNQWRNNFLRFEENWIHDISVDRQIVREENFAFFHKRVLFVGLFIVAGEGGGAEEEKERLADCVYWTLEKITKYKDEMEALVIFAHTARNKRNFDPVVQELKTLNVPILYIHGNGHSWIYEKSPFEVPGMIRVQVDNGADAPPVRVALQKERDTSYFDIDRRL